MQSTATLAASGFVAIWIQKVFHANCTFSIMCWLSGSLAIVSSSPDVEENTEGGLKAFMPAPTKSEQDSIGEEKELIPHGI
ncbi:hypothetical protein HHA02_02710 [Cobetia marina]|nr:hypothetical protein HHA02_02710 [Cobetia marina]